MLPPVYFNSSWHWTQFGRETRCNSSVLRESPAPRWTTKSHCICQHLQLTLLGIRRDPNRRNSEHSFGCHSRLSRHSRSRSHHHNTLCDRLSRAGVHRTRLEDIHRVWLESVFPYRPRVINALLIFHSQVYKFLGADRRLRKMYGNYQIFQCLIKFDVFFWVGFSVQFIIIILDNQDWEFYVTCAALPLSIILLVEGHLGARHENKMLMYTFMMGCGSGMVYFVYKVSRLNTASSISLMLNVFVQLVRVIMAKDNANDPAQKLYLTIWKSLATFCKD